MRRHWFVKYGQIYSKINVYPVLLQIVNKKNISNKYGELVILLESSGIPTANQNLKRSARLYPDKNSEYFNEYKETGIKILFHNSLEVSKISKLKDSKWLLDKYNFINTTGNILLKYDKENGYFKGTNEILFSSGGEKGMEIIKPDLSKTIIPSFQLEKAIHIAPPENRITNEIIALLTWVLLGITLFSVIVEVFNL